MLDTAERTDERDICALLDELGALGMNIREGVSPEVLRFQLMKANQRLGVLEAQLASYGGEIKSDPSEMSLSERVAWAIRAATEAAVAVQSVPFDPSGHHTPHPNDRAIPGSATRRARYQRDKLVRAIEQALDHWESSRDGDFSPIRANVPKVRCRRRDCAKYDKRVPAWDHNGVANEFCGGCGNRLPVPEEAA